MVLVNIIVTILLIAIAISFKLPDPYYKIGIFFNVLAFIIVIFMFWSVAIRNIKKGTFSLNICRQINAASKSKMTNIETNILKYCIVLFIVSFLIIAVHPIFMEIIK